jgi:hypothetical protein
MPPTPFAQFIAVCRRWWCPSIACMKELRDDSGCLLIELIAKVRGHPITQQLLHSPYVVRYPCRHSRGDGFPFLG